ncbi:MAG: M28 family peptidase, partial [Acidobacteriota bacterium]|nr:M28 family peptidase [Acidobacteriota bacterium]
TTARLSNVVGVLPGEGALADEFVVVGAHYDHLGYGGQGSMRPDEHAIHNGADDNASGVAAMLCGLGDLVRRFDGSNDARRTVVAIAFAAEEIGLGGSGWYTRNPLFPLGNTVGMVNLDMVGRVRDAKLMALGTDSSPGWPALVQEAATSAELEVATGGDGYGPSDQMSFFENDVPVVHLFSGAHDEYHTPADDVELLNVNGGRRVALLTSGLLHGLAMRVDRIAYQAASSGPSMRGDSRGYGAYLGSIPDYTAMTSTEGGGVLLGGVRPGGPADRGGVKAGDRIVEMGGVRVDNLYDMTFALREHRPGETIDIVVERDDERVTLRATLGDRGRDASPAAGEAHGAPSSKEGSGESAHGGGHG